MFGKFVQGHHTGGVQLFNSALICSSDAGQLLTRFLQHWLVKTCKILNNLVLKKRFQLLVSVSCCFGSVYIYMFLSFQAFSLPVGNCGMNYIWIHYPTLWFVQMGSTMRPTIFNDRVAKALKHWHNTARRNAKENKQSNSVTPFTSRPATPEHGTSPIRLLRSYQQHSLDSPMAPGGSRVPSEQWALTVGSYSPSPHIHDEGDDSHRNRNSNVMEPDEQDLHPTPGTVELQRTGTQHIIDVTSSEFTFGKGTRETDNWSGFRQNLQEFANFECVWLYLGSPALNMAYTEQSTSCHRTIFRGIQLLQLHIVLRLFFSLRSLVWSTRNFLHEEILIYWAWSYEPEEATNLIFDRSLKRPRVALQSPVWARSGHLPCLLL